MRTKNVARRPHRISAICSAFLLPDMVQVGARILLAQPANCTLHVTVIGEECHGIARQQSRNVTVVATECHELMTVSVYTEYSSSVTAYHLVTELEVSSTVYCAGSLQFEATIFTAGSGFTACNFYSQGFLYIKKSLFCL